MPHQDLGTLTYDVDGAVARIVLNDPGRANSQTSEMVHAFDDALTLADRDYDGEGGGDQGERQGVLRRARRRRRVHVPRVRREHGALGLRLEGASPTSS